MTYSNKCYQAPNKCNFMGALLEHCAKKEKSEQKY